MFRHLGSKRNYLHNLRLAILLCFTAGFVNAAGFLAFLVLTTNVTGHAALLAINFTERDYRSATVVALWLFLFLLGAFSSSLYINKVGRNKPYAYTLPLIVEIVILSLIATAGHKYDGSLRNTEIFAGSLLFAMGMQNALVSMVSGSVVRTTHLTGIFTDLGIDLSLVLLANNKQQTDVRRRVLLRIMIITFFLGGGIIGGLIFLNISYTAFFVPALVLVIAIFYDYFRLKWSKMLLYMRQRAQR